MDRTRRSVVVTLVAGVGGLAGCSHGPGDGTGGTDSPTGTATAPETNTESTPIDTETETSTPIETPTETETETEEPSGQTTPVEPGDPTARYTFEGSGDTITDVSGNGHDGSLKGATRADGNGGTVLSFDPENEAYATLGDPGALTPDDGAYTASCWINAVSIGSQNYKSRQALIVARKSGKRIKLELREGTASLVVGDGSNRALAGDFNNLADGEWHHIAAVVDPEAGEIVLYVDGERRATGTLPDITVDPQTPLELGAQSNAENKLYYNGQMDNVRIDRAALSAAEIAWLAENGG